MSIYSEEDRLQRFTWGKLLNKQSTITYSDYIIYDVLFSTKHDETYKEMVKCDPYSGKKQWTVGRNFLSMSLGTGFSRPRLQSRYIHVQRSKQSYI